jgi:phenylalanyl-tRNA synthetase alpha chain
MKKKIVVLKDNKIFKTKESFEDEDRNKLALFSSGKAETVSKEDLKTLKGRKLIEEKQETTFVITKGEAYREKKVELVPELTSTMLSDKSWEKAEFKKFNPASKGLEIENGNLCLLLKTRQQFIEILLEMGFEEMQTDRYVESSFWNFDSLFQPQAHPARDAHDTFFISHPDSATVEDKEYF